MRCSYQFTVALRGDDPDLAKWVTHFDDKGIDWKVKPVTPTAEYPDRDRALYIAYNAKENKHGKRK